MVKQFKNDYGTFHIGDWVCYGEYNEYYIGQITKIFDAEDKEVVGCDILVTHFMTDNEIKLTTEVFWKVVLAEQVFPLQNLLDKVNSHIKEMEQQIATNKGMIHSLSAHIKRAHIIL